MTTIYSYTNAQREDEADNIKALILFDLEKQGLIEKKIAEEYCETTTILLRNKSFFRTLTDRWRKKKSSDNMNYIVVEITKEKKRGDD